jgi:hypothetical protein
VQRRLTATCVRDPVLAREMRAMSVFRIEPVSTASGDFAAAWFDDEELLWDDARLHRPAPLLTTWTPPTLRLADAARGATHVLFNPDALAVSDRVKTSLGSFPELEFLPVHIDGVGTYYVLHVIAAIEAPAGCSLRRAPPPSGNIVELFGFPSTFEPALAFFSVLQPPDSAAGRTGSCSRDLFANKLGVAAIAATCADYLRATDLTLG